jgi:hypothetical protein
MWCPAWCSGLDVPTPPPRPAVRLSFGVQSDRWQWYLHRPPRPVVRLSFGVQSGRGCWLCASRSLLLRSWLCHSRSARLALHTPLVSFVRSAWAGPHVVSRLVQRSRCAHSAAPSSGPPLLRSSKRPLAVVSPPTATPRGPPLLWSSKRPRVLVVRISEPSPSELALPLALCAFGSAYALSLIREIGVGGPTCGAPPGAAV